MKGRCPGPARRWGRAVKGVSTAKAPKCQAYVQKFLIFSQKRYSKVKISRAYRAPPVITGCTRHTRRWTNDVCRQGSCFHRPHPHHPYHSFTSCLHIPFSHSVRSHPFLPHHVRSHPAQAHPVHPYPVRQTRLPLPAIHFNFSQILFSLTLLNHIQLTLIPFTPPRSATSYLYTPPCQP